MSNLNPNKIGVSVHCAVCDDQKNPIGRDPGIMWEGCTSECDGYRQPPFVGSLWPGESEATFGYPVGDDGAKIVVDQDSGQDRDIPRMPWDG